jgi:predicted transcriptional regulator
MSSPILEVRDLVEACISHGMRNSEIAPLLGLASSTVSYIRKQLRSEGVKARGHERIARVVTNRELLRRARDFRERLKQSRPRPTATQTETHMANAKKPAKKPAAKKTKKSK